MSVMHPSDTRSEIVSVVGLKMEAEESEKE
jgi:hypothetical protein